ncbi:hypothetical protein SRHO_G00317720 [Serrasalmus rhombeus]
MRPHKEPQNLSLPVCFGVFISTERLRKLAGPDGERTSAGDISKAPQAPYPTQGYTHMYTPPPPGPPVTTPVVSVQTVYVQPGASFGELPVQVYCPHCAQSVLTRLEYNSGTMAWLTCAGLFIFGCIYGCCLIPFCVDCLKDVTHRCPNCTSVLGVYKRL